MILMHLLPNDKLREVIRLLDQAQRAGSRGYHRAAQDYISDANTLMREMVVTR